MAWPAHSCRCPLCREDAKRLWEEWHDATLDRGGPQPATRPTDSWFAAFRKGERG